MKASTRQLTNHFRIFLFTFFILLFTVFAGSSWAIAQVSLNTIGAAYSELFDTLPASGSATWVNNSTIPGWYHFRTGTGTTIVANNGSSNAGNLYSYGCTDANAPCNVSPNSTTDRALGSLGSGNAAVGNLFWGVRLVNNTGMTITSLDVSYTGEQWRNSAAAAQTISFSYLVGGPFNMLTLSDFQSAGTAVPNLDFTSPVTGGTASALNGNLVANRTALSFTITNLSIPDGGEILLRWSDPDHTGADHGLAIDDFSITPRSTTTAASVDVSGRVLSQSGRGIRNALVTLVNEQGESRMAMTTTFGYYRFADIPAGQTYTISVSAKKYTFAEPVQVLNLSGEMDGMNFVAEN